MLDSKQAENIRKKIIGQIEKSFPEDKKEFARKQIEAMNPEELEKFLNQNKLIKTHQTSQECVFCSIISGNISSYKIDENSEAIAVLEINPYSKGHVLVIPKEHTPNYGKEPKNKIRELMEKISKTIKKNLKPKSITIANDNLFGHQVINIIPNYEGNELFSKDSTRQQIEPEELSTLKEILTQTTKKVIKSESKKLKEKIFLPKRIP